MQKKLNYVHPLKVNRGFTAFQQMATAIRVCRELFEIWYAPPYFEYNSDINWSLLSTIELL